MAYSVFISHNTDDKEWVEQIEQRLWREGFRPYMFEADARPGSSLDKKIESAIENADVLAVLITVQGQHSPWLNAEIGYAKAKEKPIIPLVDKRIEHPTLPFITDAEYIRADLDNFGDTLSTLMRDLTGRRWKGWLETAAIVLLVGVLFARGRKQGNQEGG